MARFDDYEFFRFERAGTVLRMILNRPEKLNAMHTPMRLELLRAFHDVQADEESMVVVMTGAGRGFCAGGDVGDIAGREPSTKRLEVYDHTRRLIEAQLAVEKPMLAMVNGPASGLGATLAVLCDIVVMAAETTISDRHVNVGLVAGDGGSAIWPLLVGVARAKELLMTGRLIRGDEAARLGLVNHAVPAAELEAFTMKLADELAGMPPYSVRATKLAVNLHLRKAIDAVLDTSVAWEQLSALRDEHHEATSRFLRTPAKR